MALVIDLDSNTDNASLQIGDMAYYVSNINTAASIPHSPESNIPIKIGKITAIGSNNVTIDTAINTPSNGDFIMFSKDKIVNNTSLLGYYAEVKLSNDSTDKAELFAVGSDIFESSK